MTDLIKAADALTSDSHINEMAMVMFNEWVRVDPDSNVAKNPASYMANFADMARAVDRAYRQARESADGVKVKPLMWEGHGGGYKATSIAGEYYIHPTANTRNQKFVAYFVCAKLKSWTIGYMEGAKAAKAAAQADYEARIKAALDPQ